MPKSKNRKNHKQKVNKYRNSIKERKNTITNLQKLYTKRVTALYEAQRRENVVEALITKKPNIVIDIDGQMSLDESLIEVKNGVLYTKGEQEPLFHELDGYVELSVYSIENVNIFLNSLSTKRKQTSEKQIEEPINDDGIQEAEVVEEENIKN